MTQTNHNNNLSSYERYQAAEAARAEERLKLDRWFRWYLICGAIYIAVTGLIGIGVLSYGLIHHSPW